MKRDEKLQELSDEYIRSVASVSLSFMAKCKQEGIPAQDAGASLATDLVLMAADYIAQVTSMSIEDAGKMFASIVEEHRGMHEDLKDTIQ